MRVDSDSDVSETPELEDEVSLKDVMRKLNTFEKRQHHDKQLLRTQVRADFSSVVASLVASIAKLTLDHKTTSGRVSASDAVASRTSLSVIAPTPLCMMLT